MTTLCKAGKFFLCDRQEARGVANCFILAPIQIRETSVARCQKV